MASVYLETSFIIYPVAPASRDAIVVWHQQTTQDWWANCRSEFECSVSQIVIDEASAGDPPEVQKRLAIIGALPALDVTETAEALTQALLSSCETRIPRRLGVRHVGLLSSSVSGGLTSCDVAARPN